MRFFFVPAFLITLVGMTSVVAIQSLDKLDLLNLARYEIALRQENWVTLALVASPLIGNFLLTFFWRNRHPFAGFLLAVILAAITAWGNLVDWLIWRDGAPPKEPIKFFAAFYTTWVCWGLVFVFWATGLILRGSPKTAAPETVQA